MADPVTLQVHDIKMERALEPDGHGNVKDVHHVHFTTASGTRAYVTVPHSHFSAENVAAQIHHHARQIEEVHALEGKNLHHVVHPHPAS